MNKLVILTGPSCIGKSPMDKALWRFYPELRQSLKKLVLFNDRHPRPGEMEGKDYYFRRRSTIDALRLDPKFIVMGVRGDLQALDLEELSEDLKEASVFYEGNPYVAEALITHPRLTDYPKLSMFLSPLSKEEIEYLQTPELHIAVPNLITEIMRRKLLGRKRRQKRELSLFDLEDIEKRAASAYTEMKMAWQFDYVIPNHDGEDSDNWEGFYYPVGDARKTMNCFLSLLKGKKPALAENWDENLLE